MFINIQLLIERAQTRPLLITLGTQETQYRWVICHTALRDNGTHCAVVSQNAESKTFFITQLLHGCDYITYECKLPSTHPWL